jgi:hypothetical protein
MVDFPGLVLSCRALAGGGFPAAQRPQFPRDRRGARVRLGSFFGHCGRAAFWSGRAWSGASLQGAAVEGVIRWAWHGFLQGRPGTGHVAFRARPRASGGLGKSQGAKLR